MTEKKRQTSNQVIKFVVTIWQPPRSGHLVYHPAPYSEEDGL